MHIRKGNLYQTFLILLGAIATGILGIFFYREIAPEYLLYQDRYVALETLRSSYTGEPAPAFFKGVKQIVIERSDKGPPVIDRCVSCHVALQIEDFSPTVIAKDINGNSKYDAFGFPVKIENPNYVWKHLNDKIAELKDEKVNEQLKISGEGSKVKDRLEEALRLEALKAVQVGEYVYNVEKVLAMHPLIGKETRPFEFHSIDDYGCVSCHGGNGRGLVTDRAHGPVFDHQYEIENQGYRPKFLETDLSNDPLFSTVFNNKPGHRLIFQTNPIYVGALIQAKCMECHQNTQAVLKGSASSATAVLDRKQAATEQVEKGFKLEKEAVISLVELKSLIEAKGYENSLKLLEERTKDFKLSDEEKNKITQEIKFLKKTGKDKIAEALENSLKQSFGSEELANEFAKKFKLDPKVDLKEFLKATAKKNQATGTLYQKLEAIQLNQEILKHVENIEGSFQNALSDEEAISTIQTDIDRLTADFHHGQELYISQACYACHRIAGFSRGGVGPELTLEGESYPWYVKQKISWPQSDLPTSTMPNYQLDHEELEDLVTFVLGQKGAGKVRSDTAYKTFVQEWEVGKYKQEFEKPANPSEVRDLRYSMTVFATEGCAACHRLKGFESNVGFSVEKEKVSFDTLHQEHLWFQRLFPEETPGSTIIATVEKNKEEIDRRLAVDVRTNSILEEIEQKYPGMIEAFYTNFKFAARAKNSSKDPKAIAEWKERLNRILMVYIQEYGLGRLICPRPNWAGIYRTDQWLMEHFRNPTSHVPRSIMPVFPFDDTKFYALTYLLDKLGEKNRDQERLVTDHYGFDPALAYQTHCSQCHGEYRLGNGPIAEWIYPLPKNLRNADFLRNLTKEYVIQSITHGVLGTPMPPWGEVGQDKPFKNTQPILNAEEIKKLTDWLFSNLPGSTIFPTQTTPKWQYGPKDVLKELEQEGGELKGNEKACLNKDAPYFASLKLPVAQVEPNAISKIFDIIPNPLPGGEKELYYIKKKYYTPENIQQGHRFFLINCAPCHGTGADGAGVRAEVMHDAKPRMLINLDWLKTRDDMRLLRSIKYGVPGTSMTPWGDQTSSLQRLQLVIFIRSLTQDQEERSDLTHALYRAFDTAEYSVERARVQEFEQLDKLQKEFEQTKQKRQELDRLVFENKEKPENAFKIYQEELNLALKITQRKKVDDLFQKLRQSIKEQKEIYKSIGDGFLSIGADNSLMDNYLKLISLNQDRFVFEDEKLKERMINQKEFDKLQETILNVHDQNLKKAERSKILLEGKLSSNEINSELKAVEERFKTLFKQKGKFVSGLEHAKRLQAEQKNLLKDIMTITEENKSQK